MRKKRAQKVIHWTDIDRKRVLKRKERHVHEGLKMSARVTSDFTKETRGVEPDQQISVELFDQSIREQADLEERWVVKRSSWKTTRKLTA